MSTQTPFDFRWISPLGISVALFLLCAVTYILIPIFGAIALHRYGVASPQGMGQFIFSAKADEVWFGRPPAEVVRDNPKVGKLILLFMDFMMGFMLAFGVVLFGVVWFGLRQGQGWALWIAVVGNASFLTFYWLLAILPVMREYGFRYMDIGHPFALVPTLLVPIAAILGWIGLRA